MAYNQLIIFIIYVASGIVICSLFDFFRSLRKSIKTSNATTCVEDIVFWIIAGVFLIFVINKYSLGELRGYTLFAIIIGGILYYSTISKHIIKINVFIITIFKKLVSFILKIFGKPIYFFIFNSKNIKKSQKIKK